MQNDKVGKEVGSIPPTIHREKRRSAPTATIIAPDAQANVRTIKAGKIRCIPYKKLSIHSPTDMSGRGFPELMTASSLTAGVSLSSESCLFLSLSSVSASLLSLEKSAFKTG